MSAANAAKRPNVVFILADDMGYGDFACFNYGASQTPNLDALLQESVCLTQHYSASALCAPARAGLLTGRYPHRTGIIDTIAAGEMDCMATRETTMADVFKSAGYTTGLVGKWHCGCIQPKYHPNARGFDEFAGFQGGGTDYYEWRFDYNGTMKEGDGRYSTDVFAEEASSFIKRHSREPFFLHLAFNAPHGPLQAPEEEVAPFLEDGRFNLGVSHIYGMIKRMDAGIGRVLETIEKQGLGENTIVIFTSDNGPQFSGKDEWRIERFNCGFRGSKGSVHEGGIRVPLLIRWPAGLDGNRHYHDLVHFTDWLPTLGAAIGIEMPETLALDGQNVLPALRGEGGAALNPKRFWQWSRGVPALTHNAAMRDGFWKLVVPGDVSANSFEGWREDLKATVNSRTNAERYADRPPDAVGYPAYLDEPAAPPLLFNLASDPLEKQDLADEHPERVSRMMGELENWFEDVEQDRRSIPDRQYRNAEQMRATHG
ncbi:MAG: sulfatase-like hydrolase/transferase [Verrucomicrobia bacterium]|nr:sulfatase-like hydrolase/transferase [Verrucomicrobiota bacterium]MBT7700239.1 sulfatase-like hydrolase/transferase [Verrucomicrobiota bacterium]